MMQPFACLFRSWFEDLARVSFLVAGRSGGFQLPFTRALPTPNEQTFGVGPFSPEGLIMATKIDDEVITGAGIDASKLEKGHRGLWRLSGQYSKPAAAEALTQARADAREAALARDIAAKRAPGER